MNEATALNNQERVIVLLQAHVESQKDAIKTLESKAIHNLTIVNIIAGIVAAFNLPFGAGEVRLQRFFGEEPMIYGLVAGLSVLLVGLCALVAFLSIRTLWVKRQRTHPMEPTEQNIEDWSDCEPDYFPELLQKSYLQIYNRNARIVDDKGSMVVWSHRLIVAIILVIFLGSAGFGLEYILQF